MIPKINTCIKTVQDGAEAAVIMDVENIFWLNYLLKTVLEL